MEITLFWPALISSFSFRSIDAKTATPSKKVDAQCEQSNLSKIQYLLVFSYGLTESSRFIAKSLSLAWHQNL